MSFKFLCDQMCLELGKWLRIAGYDTTFPARGEDDCSIFKKATEEKRLLLTRDRHFLELDPDKKRVIYLQNESFDGWVEQLIEKIEIDWLFHPFSRCLHCNTVFQITDPPPELPWEIKKSVKEFWICPSCHQVFWRGSHTERMEEQLKTWQKQTFLTLGLGGDLMIGRLVNEYLDTVPPSYIWGSLSSYLHQTDLNIVNLETALTRSKKIFPKVFNFKADPEKVALLREGRIDIVNLANNHVLDFSEEGLLETLEALDRECILHIGAGKNLDAAKAPVIIEKKGIKIGFLGCTDNEPLWAATDFRPGTYFIEIGNLKALEPSIKSLRNRVDLLVLSIHWGSNMRKKPSKLFQHFAHQLIDLGVDLLHGHSAHVFQGVEAYKNKLILYDTGDLVDDYAVDPILRNDQSFFFIVKMNKKKIISLKMIPILISDFQVNVSENEQLLFEMQQLCNELKTFPDKVDHFLVLN